MSTYKSLIIEERNNEIVAEIGVSNIDNLPQGDLLIKVSYSCINYMDALILNGNKNFLKKLPFTSGIDAAGVVVESNHSDFCVDDEVVITGSGLGIDIPGGFGQYIRVPASSVIHVPAGFTMKDCMTIGSDGIVAALAVMDLISSGSCQDGDNVVVSGAGLGTGSIAVALMAIMNNLNITAVIRDTENAEFAKIMGAKKVISCDKFVNNSSNSLLPDTYSVAVDTLGGNVLSTIMRSLKKNGSVAVCSSMISNEITLPIDALTVRSINILGINGINCSNNLKKTVWRKLAGDWYLKILPMLCSEISLMEVPEYSKRLLNGDIKGRIVINYDI